MGFLDLTHHVFGDLSVIKVDGKRRDTYRWLCQCKCGNFCNVDGYRLRSGKTTHCGCQRGRKIGDKVKKHGLANRHPLYKVWKDIKYRCNSKKEKHKYWGGKNINVCLEWQGENGFMSFYSWATSNGWETGLQIDRIDNNGNYEPSNCRWVTAKTNCNNKSCNINVNYNGEGLTLKECAEKYGKVAYSVVHGRYVRMGWDLNRSLLEPLNLTRGRASKKGIKHIKKHG